MATAETTIPPIANTRALLTETEREQLAGKHGDDRKYQTTSRARRRVHEELTTDMALLADHHPTLLDELREVVCANAPTTTATSGSESTTAATPAVEDARTDDGDSANDGDGQDGEQGEQGGTEQDKSSESDGTEKEQNTSDPVYDPDTSSRSWKDDRLKGGESE